MSLPEKSPPRGSGSDPSSSKDLSTGMTIGSAKENEGLYYFEETIVVARQDLSPATEEILSVIDTFKQQVVANRCAYVKKRMDENKLNLDGSCKHLLKLSQNRRNKVISGDNSIDLLTKRLNDGSTPDSIDIKLAEVKKIPPYTTWIFLDRNQRMTDDQSVVGQRRIYYDQNGGEALICSDSEEEKIDKEENKKEFEESEDYILRMTVKEVGLSDAVLDALAQCFSRKPCEIKDRYEVLAKEENSVEDLGNPLLDKDLDAALDSFDNLFCRRCLVFDCRLHGCSQDLVFPAEKLVSKSGPDEEIAPCGQHCYKVIVETESNKKCSLISDNSDEKTKCDQVKERVRSDDSGARLSKKKSGGQLKERKAKSGQRKNAFPGAKTISESSGSETQKKNSKRVAKCDLDSTLKRQKSTETSDSENSICKESQVPMPLEKPKSARGRPRKIPLIVEGATNEVINKKTACNDGIFGTEERVDESMRKPETSDSKPWKTIEKSLYQKGVEIFGRNSCLIARNLMNGMKNCSEVFRYMKFSDSQLPYQAGDAKNSILVGTSNADNNETMGNEVKRSRYLHKRGRVRRLKYSWKSAGHHLFRKRMSDKKNQPRPQFNPCGCESTCGKECPCHVNGTCCEKFCGCLKTCKNRFRGCHCAKSQCQSRQCPCFAADRECDPDVCRNCWINCGDGTLGVPSQRGDNYECRNMKLLLKQQQRVLLGPSDVSGWGAFLKNSVAKQEYLGEYTGEVISHREADKRGKIYDRENQSFLFDLNDQFVLDALRRGDKLKFANHSPEPNCVAKVMMVAGDHRVGIFSKERINAGEELFYDYCYSADRAPDWARKPEEPGSKREEAGPSSGRARKLA